MASHYILNKSNRISLSFRHLSSSFHDTLQHKCAPVIQFKPLTRKSRTHAQVKSFERKKERKDKRGEERFVMHCT